MDLESKAQVNLQATALIRNVLAISDAGLRVGYLLDFLVAHDVETSAVVLDVWCQRAEQAEEGAREALVALVDTLLLESAQATLQRLREEAAGQSLLALDRLVRFPVGRLELMVPSRGRIPDYGKGRPLTLGERKSLARNPPSKQMMERLLGDPHPDVIRFLLAAPRMTEELVLRLTTRRPCRPDVLMEIARSPRWSHRPAVRRALILNPFTPLDLATALVGLLPRGDLRYVAETTTVSPAIRALCYQYLERRPPVESDERRPEPEYFN